mmetsp:Transcript_8215/g.24183  ORF Transcript_8215/g.24183 Transcript_8215/m.24183 type:complete len:358 (+) Transcript_8215:51-1124(+)|eukprot:CAMPEP_0206043576 /NCGR_PEP_ID=MMETSP1466-20131121/9434_1 /ASSEMBLY_ACC=CAM_ASM_001126 /TAXON_ID=44452 /ORGANISM="Pavlova gyrans, Strain CCMP608" /LENGTH=357 /DNA_ID=CAMNT_0053418411 /DNA_START=38 /DNA_END=1111 /DNA_ORIENTATION=+
MPNFQPVGQKRLTNIAVVRVKKGGKRFEIACFPNKVLNWRSGVEKDLEEVVHSFQIYTNVSKGVLAKGDDMAAAFGTDDDEEVCKQILKEGDLQVSDKERQLQLESLFHEIATIVADKCVDAITGQPLTVSLIEKAMHNIHYSVVVTRSAKQQALEVIKALEHSDVGIMRAQMRLRVRADKHAIAEVKAFLEGLDGTKIEQENMSGDFHELVCLVNSGSFRELNQVVAASSRMSLEVIDAKAAKVENSSGGGPSGPSASAASTVEERLAADTARLHVGKAARPVDADQMPAGAKFSCKTCPGGAFDSAQAHREHFKSDWHKYNLSLKTKNLPTVPFEEFTERAQDLSAASEKDDFFK